MTEQEFWDRIFLKTFDQWANPAAAQEAADEAVEMRRSYLDRINSYRDDVAAAESVHCGGCEDCGDAE